jgi:hypothetical protein
MDTFYYAVQMSAAEMEEYVRKVVALLALSDQPVEVGTRFSLAVVPALRLPSVSAELSCVLCIARLWKIEVIPVMGIDQKACLVWDEAAVERTLCMSLMDALVLEDGFVETPQNSSQLYGLLENTRVNWSTGTLLH